MDNPWVLFSALVGLLAASIALVLVIARLWRSQERNILLVFGYFSLAALLLGALVAWGAFATGGGDVTVTITNDTPWDLEVSATNVGDTTITPGETRDFTDNADLGLSGLIDDLSIYGGSDGRTRIFVVGITDEQDPSIRISTDQSR